jgi:hypothetical protein
MKSPNFFIVGAPKGGTTALSEYLRSHSRIFMSVPKEPHFFAMYFPGYREVRTWSDYQALFSDANDSYLAVGEASVFYLYSEVALKEVKKAYPDARLLVMLRNPVDLDISMHAQVLRTRDETVQKFESAWALCEQRRNGRKVPRHCREARILLYDRLPMLGRQLQHLLDTFPQEQVHWWFYDDFSLNPSRVYREALEFLNVPDDGRSEFARINVRSRARSQLLAQFTRKTPKSLGNITMWAKKKLGIKRLGVIDFLRRFNTVIAEPEHLPPDLIAEMHEHFAPDVKLLESITGRDLSHWQQSRVSDQAKVGTITRKNATFN